MAGDVDPRVGEHLLDVLGARGIAAYLQPAADLHPITRTTTMPSRPTDRLYVDRAHVQTARRYVAELAENPPPAQDATPAERAGDNPPDVETQWARIVAQFRAEAEAESRPWPDPSTDAGRVGRDSAAGRPSRTDEPSLLDALDTFGADLPDDEGSYTPPPPPPLPRPSKVAVAAVLGIVAGFILFLRPDLLPLNEGLTQLAGFTAVLAGVVALILRLRPGGEDDEDADPDHGAVV